MLSKFVFLLSPAGHAPSMSVFVLKVSAESENHPRSHTHNLRTCAVKIDHTSTHPTKRGSHVTKSNTHCENSTEALVNQQGFQPGRLRLNDRGEPTSKEKKRARVCPLRVV